MSYKAALKEWFKGTGSGPGIDAAFQTWDDDKLDRYNIDLDTYDHTDVASRPIVLFDNYTRNKIPYLTVIRMWDKLSDYLLSAKHDPLIIGSGEVGFVDNVGEESEDLGISGKKDISKKRLSPNKRKYTSTADGFDDLSSLMSSVVSTCKQMSNPVPPTPPSSKKSHANIVAIQDLPLDDLYKLLAQHRQHLEFLKQCDMCDEQKTRDIVGKCEFVFEIINSRTASTSETGVSLA